MLAAGALGEVEVLEVGHHGSDTSSGQAFVDVVKLKHAVISAGLDSQYAHPHEAVVARLVATAADVYLTDTTTADDP